MGTGNADADEAVLNMLQRYEVLMMEDLISGLTRFQLGTIVSRHRPAEPKEPDRAPSSGPDLSNSPDEPRVDPRPGTTS